MAFSHKKKLLTLSAFVALSFSQGTLGGEACLNQLNDNGNGTQTLTRLHSRTEITETTKDSIRKTLDTTVEDMRAKERAQKEHAEQQRTREFLGIGPDYQPSLWDIPSMFVKTLFQPFIEDAAPKVAAAVRQKIEKEGVAGYMLSTTGKVVTTIIENPLESIILGSAFALGHADLGEYTSTVQIAASTAGKIKNGVLPLVKIGVGCAPMLIPVLKEEGSKFEQDGYTLDTGRNVVKAVADFVQSDAFWTMAKVGAAYYLLSSIPGAEAQYTPVLGTQYKINQNSIVSASPFSSVALSNGAVVTGWPNSASNMVARIHFPNNGTFVTGELTISSSPSSGINSQLTPCLGSFSNGNWFMTWLQSTSVLNYRILNSVGGTVAGPTQINSAGETFVQVPSCVGLGTRGFIGWANSTSGTDKDLFVTFGSDGSGLSAPVLLQQSSGVLGGSRVTALADGNVYALYGGSGLQASEITPTGSIGTPTTITLSPALAIIDPTGLVGGSGKDALLLGTASNNLKGIAISNGVPSSTQFTVHSAGTINIVGPSAAGLTDGNALVAFQTGDTSGNPIVNGTLISPTGALLSQEFTISSPTLNGLGGPQVTRLPGGGAFVTMGDGSDFYGRMVSFTGTTGTPTTTGTTGTPTTTGTTGTPSSTSTTGPTGAPTSAADSLSPSSALMGGVLALASLFLG